MPPSNTAAASDFQYQPDSQTRRHSILTHSVQSKQTVVNYLLEKGVDHEAQSFGGLRPLHHACNASREVRNTTKYASQQLRIGFF